MKDSFRAFGLLLTLSTLCFFATSLRLLGQEAGGEDSLRELLHESDRLREQGAFEKALKLRFLARNRAYENGAADLAREATHGIGGLYYASGNYLLAINYWEEALQLAIEAGSTKWEAACYNNIGEAYNRLGYQRKSLRAHQKAAQLYEKLNDPLGWAQHYMSMGDTYASLRNRAAAKRAYRRGMHILDTLTHIRFQAELYQKLGHLAAGENQVDTALSHYRKALELYWQHQKSYNENAGDVYVAIGELWLSQPEGLDSARYFFGKARHLVRAANARQTCIAANIGEAAVLLEESRREVAIRLADSMLAEAERLPLLPQQLKALAVLHRAHAALGNYSAALRYHIRLKSLQDEFFGKKNVRELGMLEVHQEQNRQKAQQLQKQEQAEALYRDKIDQQENNQIILSLFISIFLIVLVLLINGYLLLKRKNQQLEKRENEVSYLNQNLEEQVRQRTQQLEDYAFMNVHKVRGPLARIQGLAGLFAVPQALNKTEHEEMVRQIAIAAQELDLVVKSINDRLSE